MSKFCGAADGTLASYASRVDPGAGMEPDPVPSVVYTHTGAATGKGR